MDDYFKFDSLPVSGEEVRSHIKEHYPEVTLKKKNVLWVFLFGVVKIIGRLSDTAAYSLGCFIGKLLYLIKLRSDIAHVNLDIVYGGTKSFSEKDEIYRKSLMNFGNVIVNYMRLPFSGEEKWKKSCKIINEDILKTAVNRKKGVIFIGGHIGMWDLAGGKVGMSGYPIAVITKRVSNPVINKFVYDARTSMAIGTIDNKKSMEKILGALSRGECLVVAIDQNIQRVKGTFIKWMGRPASSVKSTAYIAKTSGAAVVSGFLIQNGPGDFTLTLGDEMFWESFPDDPEKELLVNLQNQSNAVQKIILDYPEHWFWIHKRWKYQPDGIPDPYKKQG